MSEGSFQLAGGINGYDLTPDGREFLILRNDSPHRGLTEYKVVLNWFQEPKSLEAASIAPRYCGSAQRSTQRCGVVLSHWPYQALLGSCFGQPQQVDNYPRAADNPRPTDWRVPARVSFDDKSAYLTLTAHLHYRAYHAQLGSCCGRTRRIDNRLRATACPRSISAFSAFSPAHFPLDNLTGL